MLPTHQCVLLDPDGSFQPRKPIHADSGRTQQIANQFDVSSVVNLVRLKFIPTVAATSLRTPNPCNVKPLFSSDLWPLLTLLRPNRILERTSPCFFLEHWNDQSMRGRNKSPNNLHDNDSAEQAPSISTKWTKELC